MINFLCDRPPATSPMASPPTTTVCGKRQNAMVHASYQKTQHHKGFTLVEVLIGILIIAAFSATAMQALVASTAMKIKSQELSESTNWMQEDLENVKFEANRLDFTASSYTPVVANCTPGTPDQGYAKKLKDRLDAIEAALPAGSNLRSSNIGNRQYELLREETFDDPSKRRPWNILQVNYSVQRVSDGKTIGTLHSEVIPDVAFACP